MPQPDLNDSLDDSDMRLFDSGNFADATIVCGDRTWKVHKLILSSRSKWFKAAFHGNMAEAASGKIELQEQDPDFVDDMLRFLYAKSVDIPNLRDGKDVPLLCVELFRVADFFIIPELAKTAKEELRDYLSLRMTAQDKNKTAMPETLTEVLDSIRRAYKDNSTAPLRQRLLTFLWMRKDRYLQARATIALIDELPEFGKDLTKTFLSVDLSISVPNHDELPRALPVLEAVLGGVQAYSAGGPSQVPKYAGVKHFKTPCMLRPQLVEGCRLHHLFEVVDSTTGETLPDMGWIAPHPDILSQIYSNGDSSIVQFVYRDPHSGKGQLLQIRLACPADAKHCVGRYRNAVPSLEDKEERAEQMETEMDQYRDNLYKKAIGAPCEYH